MRRRRRLRRLGLLACGVGIATVALGWHVGWFATPEGWRRATGWNRIPVDERPPVAPVELATFRGDPPEIRWLGHSGFSVRWGDAHLLIDPNLDRWCTISRRLLEPVGDPATLGRVDAVLISHAHFDHLDRPTLRALPAVDRVLLPSGNETLLPAELSDRARPLRPGERLSIGALDVVAVPAAHNSDRLHPLHSAPRALGYVIRRGDEAIYYSGDTGARNDFESIRRAFHPGLAILPIGAHSPSFPLRRYHLSPEDAVAVARRLGVRTVIPCHFGTFALSLDRPRAALPRFARAATRAGLRWEMPQLWSAETERSAFARRGGDGR